MFNLLDLFKTHQGRIIVSIIWGLGLACLFKRVCVSRNCVIYKAPNPEDIRGSIYSHGDKCYSYSTETSTCEINNSKLNSQTNSQPVVEFFTKKKNV